jgi:hypothetical protein
MRPITIVFEIVGKSAALREVLKQVETIAPTGSTMLFRARPEQARLSLDELWEGG